MIARNKDIRYTESIQEWVDCIITMATPQMIQLRTEALVFYIIMSIWMIYGVNVFSFKCYLLLRFVERIIPYIFGVVEKKYAIYERKLKWLFPSSVIVLVNNSIEWYSNNVQQWKEYEYLIRSSTVEQITMNLPKSFLMNS